MKYLKIITLLTIVLAISFSFTSCSSDNDEIEKKEEVIETLETQIVGGWIYPTTDEGVFVFEKDGKCWFYMENAQTSKLEFVHGSYKISGNEVTVLYEDQIPYKFTEVSISGKIMKVTRLEASENLVTYVLFRIV